MPTVYRFSFLLVAEILREFHFVQLQVNSELTLAHSGR